MNLTQSRAHCRRARVLRRGRPAGVMGGSLLYGLVAAIVLAWKSLRIIPLSASDLAATARRAHRHRPAFGGARFRQPAALGRPYREEREDGRPISRFHPVEGTATPSLDRSNHA